MWGTSRRRAALSCRARWDFGFELAGAFAWDSSGARTALKHTMRHTGKRELRLNMANNPKKVKDPTEVALSAIQEALNISDTPDNARSSTRSEAAPTSSSATPDYNEPSFDTRDAAFDTRPNNALPIFELVEEPRSPRRAANDDRETIGQILQAIQKG